MMAMTTSSSIRVKALGGGAGRGEERVGLRQSNHKLQGLVLIEMAAVGCSGWVTFTFTLRNRISKRASCKKVKELFGKLTRAERWSSRVSTFNWVRPSTGPGTCSPRLVYLATSTTHCSPGLARCATDRYCLRS